MRRTEWCGYSVDCKKGSPVAGCDVKSDTEWTSAGGAGAHPENWQGAFRTESPLRLASREG